MKDSQVTIRLNEQEKEALKEAARGQGVTMSELIRELLKSYLKRARRDAR